MMVTLKSYLKLVIPVLILGSMLFGSEWIGSASAPDQIPVGPIALEASPLPQGESESAKAKKPSQYQTWQELAYLSVLFERLAHTYRGLELEAKGEKGHLVKFSGEDPTRWWKDPDPCLLNPVPPCAWTVGEYAICDSLLVTKIGDVLRRADMGIAEAVRLLGADGTFTFKYTKLYVPDEKWLERDRDRDE